MRPRGVMVLGMHRSGTSAVTGVLAGLGFTSSRPDDSVRGPWNPRGHHESWTLMAVDEQLLDEMGCTWWYPPPAGPQYHDALAKVRMSSREARRAFRHAYPARRWAWKDPRACLLLPFWRTVLRDRAVAVVVLRNPLDVAASLDRRNGIGIPLGVALWQRYNRLLLEHAAGMPAIVTRFDDLVDDAHGWQQTVARQLSDLGLATPAPREPDLEAVGAELRHSVHGRPDVAAQFPDALALYDALESLVGCSEHFAPPVLGPEAPGVQTELDTLGPDRRPELRQPPWSNQANS